MADLRLALVEGDEPASNGLFSSIAARIRTDTLRARGGSVSSETVELRTL